MSIKTKRGKIVGVAPKAVKDIYVSENVLDVILENEDGERIQARYIPRGGLGVSWEVLEATCGTAKPTGEQLKTAFGDVKHDGGRTYTTDPYGDVIDHRYYMKHEIRISPAIGDTVEISWDYGQCTGQITALAEGNRQPIPRDYPAEGKRSFALDDILSSLDPSSSE